MRATTPTRKFFIAPLQILHAAMLTLLCAFAGCAETSTDQSAAASGDASADLIQRALSAGEITAHEATAYRVHALFGDPALPKRFDGAPMADHGAVVQAWTQLDEMPEALAATVRPYLLRPTNPKSAFSGAARNQSDDEDRCPSANSRPIDTASAHKDGECAAWISQSLLPAPFRVWACATPTRTQGSEILGGKLQDKLSATLQKMILNRPLGMGPPLPDVSDHREHRDLDELIDIYILPTCALTPPRFDHQGVMEKNAYGIAFPTETTTPKGNSSASSGYLLVEESLLEHHDDFLGTVVHEVFHVQQFAQSVDILPAVSWFMESTATWAELYFGPPTYKDAYDRHLPRMQVSPLELTATFPHDHQYQAHVWPLYMQQHAETGADSIFEVWERLADSTTLFAADDLLKHINLHVPWQDHYPQFAAQLLNLRLNGDPAAPYFTEVDSRFPASQTPDLNTLKRQHRLPATTDPVLDYSSWGGEPKAPGVPGLAYRYDRIVIDAGKLPKSWGLKLTPDERLKDSGKAGWMEILIREKEGPFQRVVVDPSSGGEWCNVTEIVVILSVPSATGHVDGSMSASIDEAPLCALSGDLKLSVSGDYRSPILQLPAPNTVTIQISGSLIVKLGKAQERLKEGERALPPGLQKQLGLPDPPMERFYPDVGSQWNVTGTIVESACVRGSFDCIPRITVQLSAGAPSKIKLEVIGADGELTLLGSVPVVETSTAYLPILPGGPEVRRRNASWPLVCHTRGGVGAQMHGNFVMDLFLAGTRHGTPLGGNRVAGRNTVKVHCDNMWSPYRYGGDGETSTMRQTWTGEFALGS